MVVVGVEVARLGAPVIRGTPRGVHHRSTISFRPEDRRLKWTLYRQTGLTDSVHHSEKGNTRNMSMVVLTCLGNTVTCFQSEFLKLFQGVLGAPPDKKPRIAPSGTETWKSRGRSHRSQAWGLWVAFDLHLVFLQPHQMASLDSWHFQYISIYLYVECCTIKSCNYIFLGLFCIFYFRH